MQNTLSSASIRLHSSGTVIDLSFSSEGHHRRHVASLARFSAIDGTGGQDSSMTQS
jgi:hypothetical protein